VKNAEKPIIAGDMEFAAKEAVVAISTLDKAANKGAIHPNKAARTKSRLMKKLNKAQQITSQAKAEKK
jgi:small subunit ribosomal protein S20